MYNLSMTILTDICIKLVGAHYLGDFALQSDFMAVNKAPGRPYWGQVMFAHCVIHAFMVYLVTGSWRCAALELVSHFIIDVAKCTGWIGFNQDQALHILCKAAYVFFVF